MTSLAQPTRINLDLAVLRLPLPDVLGYALHFADEVGWPTIAVMMLELHKR